MDWEPISEAKLWDKLNAAASRMDAQQERLWEAIRIPPEKWEHDPYGKIGGGFWAVGLLGKRVLWYNDIEEGFNSSTYSRYGHIDEYWCNQDELEHTVQHLLNLIANGSDSAPRCTPPRAGPYESET